MTDAPERGPAAPTPPIALADGEITARAQAARVEVSDDVVARLGSICATVTTEPASLAEAGRDWWPLAISWALESQVGGIGAVLCQPNSPAEVAAVARLCSHERIPLTVAAGRSGVMGGSVPLHGGVVLDLCGLTGIVDVDDHSLTARVRAGTFGDHFEHELRTAHGLTAGHWPQSMALATVGGWVACRGAGQLSTRYGKIEDMVNGLSVVLADGRQIRTGGSPRQATGPDLNQLFIGSEGTLGIICEVDLRLHPAPVHERRGAWAFDSFSDGLDACRRILRRGATPAVLRLYDEIESDRSYHTGSERCVVIGLDEGDEPIVEGTWTVVEQECATAERLSDDLVAHWLTKRNDVSQLETLISGGLIVDTMEISAPWARLDAIYAATVAAIGAIPGVLAVSAHQSHAYTDGACLYFTFAGKAPDGVSKDEFYRSIWDHGTRAVLGAGGSLSHHHGVGVNRARYMAEALGGGLEVFQAVKDALDPTGILNPSKMGLASPFGSVVIP